MDGQPGIIRQAVERGVVELYSNWLDRGEPVPTPAEMANLLHCTAVRIGAATPVTLTFRFRDVFGRHSVAVEVDDQLRVTRMSLDG
jgi:hypothetical protein